MDKQAAVAHLLQKHRNDAKAIAVEFAEFQSQTVQETTKLRNQLSEAMLVMRTVKQKVQEMAGACGFEISL